MEKGECLNLRTNEFWFFIDNSGVFCIFDLGYRLISTQFFPERGDMR
jgi:hypothetical protein